MHLLTLKELKKEEILELVEKAIDIKKNPKKYSERLKNKTLLMLFELPSLRTRVSFEVAMTQLGGHAIFYSVKDSPLGEKESIEDTAKVISRYCDIVMVRLLKHEPLVKFAKNSSIPVINALTDFAHPCQILSDLMTIKEKKGNFNLKLAYLGDSNNNVTHSLIYGCSKLGINISIGCPKGKEFEPQEIVLKEAKKFALNPKIKIFYNAEEAVKDADIVYTDSWMSYRIPKEEKEKRVKIFMPYQVNSKIMKKAKKDALFMNCLPALRGYEQTKEVIDGPQSIVFDQAENRLHMQKAILLKLLGKI